MTSGKVNIHGKEYETVASRVQRFREKYPNYSIMTRVISRDENEVLMRATIADDAGRTIATGHAEEQRQSSQINRTSALENAETSAIGRALAAFGIGGTEFASADEVATAIKQRSDPAPARPSVGTAPIGQTVSASEPAETGTRPLVTEAQAKLLFARTRDATGLKDTQEIYDAFVEQYGCLPEKVHRDEVDEILKDLSVRAVEVAA